MAYAVRYMSPTDHGMLVEMDGRALAKIKCAQDAADEAREAYWDTPDGSRPAATPPPETFPYYEIAHFSRAHSWVRSGAPHETLLYTEDGKIRRAA